jgi:hypothetical protein
MSSYSAWRTMILRRIANNLDMMDRCILIIIAILAIITGLLRF